MKLNVFLSMAILVLLTTALALSCQEDKEDKFDDLVQTDLEMKTLSGAQMTGWYPDDSKVQFNEAGDLVISPPAGWAYLGTTQGGDLKIENSDPVTVSCECTEGSGCDPVFRFGQYGCFMKPDCSKCKKSVTSIGPNEQGIISSQTFIAGGFINLDDGVKWLNTTEDQPMVYSEMFQFDFIRSAVEEFLHDNGLADLIDAQYDPTANYFSFPVSIFGRYGIIKIPEYKVLSQEDNSILSLIEIGGDYEFTCSCTEGICPKKISIAVHYCDSRLCTGVCSMTIHPTVANGGNGVLPPGDGYKY